MSAKKQTVKYIIYCLIILGCDLLQNVQGLFPEVWGARCFLLLPVTIILAMGEDEKNGAFLGLFAGLLWDLTSGVHMGFNCIFIMIMCFFSCALVTYIARDIFITNFVFNNSCNSSLWLYLLAFLYNHKGCKRRRNDACNILHSMRYLYTCAHSAYLSHFKTD